MSLDMEYLGCSVDIPGWDVLVMAPPVIEHMGGLANTEFTKDSMQKSADLGIILKFGDKSFEEVDKNNIPLKEQPPRPYSVGDLILFEDFHPQAKNINGVMVYFIPDTKIVCRVPNPRDFDHYLLFEESLRDIRNAAAIWQGSSIEDRKRMACI